MADHASGRRPLPQAPLPRTPLRPTWRSHTGLTTLAALPGGARLVLLATSGTAVAAVAMRCAVGTS